MARLFVSYARKDGAELARRLEHDLPGRGYEPWIDRAGIRGGDDWAVQVEEAIDASDTLLALLTRGAYTSRICRGEQARALRKGKLVVPLLVQEDADRPIYLETAHYIAFAPPRSYAEAFEQLVADLQAQRGVRWDTIADKTRERVADQERLALVDPLSSWTNLQAAAAQHTRKVLADLAGTDRHAGTFDAGLFVPRQAADQEMARFLAGDRLTFVLAGEAGVGKTNVLCQWASDRMAAGDAVFLYSASSLTTADLARRLSEDLSWDDVPQADQMLSRLDHLAAEAGRRCFVVVDGVNDFAGPADADPVRRLLQDANDLTGRLPGAAVRLVLSCSTATWNRLDRQGALRTLHWGRFHRADGEERPVTLGAFTPDELEVAYARYRERFDVRAVLANLPPRVREALRHPVLLRLFAETQGGRDEPITEGTLEAGVYRRYWERCLGRTGDQMLVERLAGLMYERRRASLSLHDLAADPDLGTEVRADTPGTAFTDLVQSGVIAITRGDLYTDDEARFTHGTIGAYALARHLRRGPQPAIETVTTLLRDADAFPLAWDAAQALLLVEDDPAAFIQLAASRNAEARELVAETLCKLHGINQDSALAILRRLMDGESDEGRRTALRAAYGIGPETRALFIRAAMRGSPDLRQAAKDTLYLIWRQAAARSDRAVVGTLYLIWRRDAEFVYGLLDDLVARLRLRDLMSVRNTLEFVIDLSITIYINHCERPDVIERTANLYHELAVNRLRLPKLSLGDTLEDLILRVLGVVFSGRILRWMLQADADDPARLFGLPTEQRAPLRRVGRLLDPAENLASGREDLTHLLQHDLDIMRGAAALVLAVHSTANFPAVEPLHRDLFAELQPRGRLSQLLSFSVLYPDTPAAWIDLIAEFTRTLFEETPEALEGPLSGDLFSVPLGLACAKAGRPMRLFETWLRDGLEYDDGQRIRAVLAGLGPVGFYFPDAVLQTVRPFVSELAAGEYREEIRRTLAVMRTLHLDAVDAFLSNAGADESFQRDIAVASDVALLHRYITLLGYYNNAVHFSIFYPRMRRAFSSGGLTLLAESRTSPDFVAEYAKVALRLFREADFNLIEWTRPDGT